MKEKLVLILFGRRLGVRRTPKGGRRVRPARAQAWRILCWSLFASLVIGALGLAQPLEDELRTTRNKLRTHAPSGQIVIVGIDDRSLEEIGSWPWPRRRHVALIDRLRAAGADRIFFDVSFATTSTPADDRAFVDALKRSGGIYLAAMRVRDPATGERHYKLPRPEYRDNAGMVSVAVTHAGSFTVRQMDYATDLGGLTAPTMAAKLARTDGAVGSPFFIDYAISPRHVPFVSARDVLRGKLDPGSLKGKDIVIGGASTEMGDVYAVPGFGQLNGIFINVIAAETLKAGGTIQIGWLLPLIIGVLLAAINLFARNRWARRIAVGATVGGLIIMPVFAEAQGIFYDIMPALFLMGASAACGAWSSFRRSYKVRGHINGVSGLPNLNALRDEKATADTVVVAARVRNFAEIISSLPPEGEQALAEQIVGRLALGARGAQIYQGDEGIFAWLSTSEITGPDQLDALHALFRSPALIDGRPIDLSVTLGIDADGDRSLVNRIGATLVAADEAATEGLRWKTYDPAKLEDAEWKLSLLSRLDSAIDTGEIWVAYQPQLDVASGRICGAEALVRWSHPEKGEVSPVEFVLAAERHNRIDKLTAFVLDDAIRAAASFHARGIAFDVAVNISARMLEKRGLVPMVRDMLRRSGLPPERLTLEVTESAAMASGRASIRTLEEIGSLGINVSIDDYGTGFSTLEYFKKIPATEVKIDRSFVASIDRNAADRLMVRSTIELAHSLGRSVVAEGVETQQVLAELTNLGCDRIQGYLIGRPMKLLNLNKVMLGEQDSRVA